MPKLHNSKGIPTGATLGVLRMIQKIVREIKPDYVVVAMDSPTEVERKKTYPEYKANRPPPPEELKIQIKQIEEILNLYGFKTVTKEGWEADDVIASITKEAKNSGLNVIIVSSDKDLMQLIGAGVKLLYEDPRKKQMITMDEEAVEKKYHVPPSAIRDWLAMVGDSVDNIPGIPGIGKKTAADLLSKYGSLDRIMENCESIKKNSLKKAIKEGKDLALLSLKLVTLKDDLFDGEIEFDSFRLRQPDYEKLMEKLRQLEFRELLSQIKEQLPDEVKPSKGYEIEVEAKKHYFTIFDTEKLKDEIQLIEKAQEVSIDVETTDIDPICAKIVGISLSWKEGRGCYIPVGHIYMGAPTQPRLNEVLNLLRPILTSRKIKKYGHNIKYDYIVLSRHGINIENIEFDTMIASHLIDPEAHQHRLEQIAMSEMSYTMITYNEITTISRGKKISFAEVPVETATRYSAEDAEITFCLTERLKKKIKDEGLKKIYTEVELPLIKVLAVMQITGIKIESSHFTNLEKEFSSELMAIEKEAWKIAGVTFNIASSRQLQEVLFSKLGLEKTRKTKTGYSTDSDALKTINHPIAKKILEFREVYKLLSTYVRALQDAVNPQTGKIHTSFNQTGTATGRLSSSNPNLQNIPVRTERGKRIRKGFTASSGGSLLSADYSQIELRVLAHFSLDETLVKAFKKDEDIHRVVAARLYGVEVSEVTSQMRSNAKAVNFGIIYGQSGYGLAQQTGLSKSEADKFIKRYFEKFCGVKNFMESLIKGAQSSAVVKTILGRRRFLRKIRSQNRTERQMAERMARNTPIQGSAADIIKLAMVKIFNTLNKGGYKAKMILTIHDELVFDVPVEERREIEKIVRETMEGCIKLNVPLKAQIGWGRNWAEAHP